MSCYACGSPEGNDAKLCPDCNQRKTDEHHARIAQLSTKSEDIPAPPLTQQQKTLLIVGSFLLLFGIWWLFSPKTAAIQSSSTSASSAPSSVEAAFSACLRKLLGPEGGMSDEEATHNATETCTAFKAPCVSSIESPDCQLFVKEYISGQ